MSEPELTSLQNPQVKQLVKLRQARERARTGLTRIDGARELERALDGGLVPLTVYVCPERLLAPPARAAVDAAVRSGSRLQPISAEVYSRIQYGDRDEGLCATVHWQPRGLESLSASPRAFLVVLEGLEKPGNLGAVLRTADAVGVDAVLLADTALDPTNPNAVRASMGTLFTVPVVMGTTLQTAERLGQLGVGVIVSQVAASRLYTDVDLRGSIALVLGPERDAPSPVWQETALHAVRIPMRGAADSLNVSVAAAVLMFEALRQRSNPQPPTGESTSPSFTAK